MKKLLYLVLLVIGLNNVLLIHGIEQQPYKNIIMTNLDAFKVPLKNLGNINNVANSFNDAYTAINNALTLDTSVLSKENIDSKFKTAINNLQNTRNIIGTIWKNNGSLFTKINFDFDAHLAKILNYLNGAVYIPTITKDVQDFEKQIQQVSGDNKQAIDLHVAALKNSIDAALADAALVVNNKDTSNYVNYKKNADISFEIARQDFDTLKTILDKQKSLSSSSVLFDYANAIQDLKKQLDSYINFLGD